MKIERNFFIHTHYLFLHIKRKKDPFPPYDSRINITPSDYFLGEDNPDLYIGRKTKECEEYIKSLKSRVAYIAGEASKTV